MEISKKLRKLAERYNHYEIKNNEFSWVCTKCRYVTRSLNKSGCKFCKNDSFQRMHYLEIVENPEKYFIAQCRVCEYTCVMEIEAEAHICPRCSLEHNFDDKLHKYWMIFETGYEGEEDDKLDAFLYMLDSIGYIITEKKRGRIHYV